MNWDAVAAVAEALGALGVIITVAYLALQIRQNTRAVRSAAHQGMFDNTHQSRLAVSQDADLAGLLLRANEDYDGLSDEEQLRFNSFAGVILGEWENVFFQRSHAAVAPEMWLAWDLSYREFLAAPANSRVWELEKNRFLPAFRMHVDGSE